VESSGTPPAVDSPPVDRDKDEFRFQLAKEALLFEHARNDAADSKVGQHLTMVGIALATAGVVIDAFVRIAKRNDSPADTAFLIAFSSAVVGWILSGCLLVRALAFRTLAGLPVTKEFAAFFDRTELDDARRRIGFQIWDAALHARDAVEEKYEWIVRGRAVMFPATILSLIAAALFVVIRIQEKS